MTFSSDRDEQHDINLRTRNENARRIRVSLGALVALVQFFVASELNSASFLW